MYKKHEKKNKIVKQLIRKYEFATVARSSYDHVCRADHMISNAAVRQQSHPNEPVYRPMQVFDYQNSNMAAKVIDYGHKSVETGSRISPGPGIRPEPDYRPVKTFEYGHALRNVSMSITGHSGSGSGSAVGFGANGRKEEGSSNNISNDITNKRKSNKKKNKQQRQQARMQMHLNRQLYSIPRAESDSYIENNEQHDAKQSVSFLQTDTQQEIDADGVTNNSTEDLEDISDGDEILTDRTTQDEIHATSQSESSIHFESFPTEELLPQTMPDKLRTPDVCVPTNENFNTISIDEVLAIPGRLTRPKRICIIMRGPPGSGKSYIVRLIKDKESEMGGANPRILSIDDYFIIENDYEEKCPKTGKKIPKKEILYEYDETMEDTYMQYLIKSYKKTLSDNLYDFIIVDCNNNSLRTLNEFYCHAKDANFVPYIIDLHCDLETCLSRNSHKRSEGDIQAVLDNWCATPLHYIKLDVASLLENVVEMEDVENMATDDNAFNEDSTAVATDEVAEEDDSNSADASNNQGFLKSKWENDTSKESLARLDGTKNLLQKRKTASMADFLQMDDWKPPANSTDGKKRVRWADIEERRAQEKMRAIGFVVGQTDWKRMMDPNAGNRALNKTKYIERVNKPRR